MCHLWVPKMTMTVSADIVHKSMCCISTNNCVTLANLCVIFTLGHTEIFTTYLLLAELLV